MHEITTLVNHVNGIPWTATDRAASHYQWALPSPLETLASSNGFSRGINAVSRGIYTSTGEANK